ncbi:hypothetical protein NX059_000073 [Plenodomus lindquistii]|nr:hypothetical protein NX059_000073 [Plenodomus lindquistii]
MYEDQSYPEVYFARLPSVDLRTCAEFRKRESPLPGDGEKDDDLDEILAEQHGRNFKDGRGSRPSWQLIVLVSDDESGTFIASWFYHHALAEGASALLFHQTLLEGINAALDTQPNPIVLSPDIPLLPPLEGLHPMPISWSFFIQTIARAVMPSIFAKRPQGLWTGRLVPADIQSIPMPHHCSTVFSAQTTKKLAEVCRKESTTVTAALQALLAAVLFSTLTPEECERLQIDGPMSMRPLLDVKDDEMITAISQYTFTHIRRSRSSVSEDESQEAAIQFFSWSEACAVKSSISAVIANQGRDNPIALLKYASDMPKFFLEKLGKARSPSAELWNVGMWKKGQRWWSLDDWKNDV